jgi:hypothetical protein
MLTAGLAEAQARMTERTYALSKTSSGAQT